MEFEYTGTIYIDVDKIYERCRELNYIDTEDIYEAVRYEIAECEDDTYYNIEGWMIDEIVKKKKKRIDKELGM